MTTPLKSLKHKQRKHAELLQKVEKAAKVLDRRKLRLSALEADIAGLERRIADTRTRTRRGAAGPARPGLRQAQLIFNPASGRDESNNTLRLSQVVQGLRAHGIEVAIGLKTSGKAARTLAHDAARSGCPLVVVAAGDGTVEDVAAQLVGSETVLGVIPIGTMNNLARSLGIPLDIEAACGLIGMGTTRHIDIGRVTSNQTAHQEYFLECAGVGLSAVAALAGQTVEKRRWRTLPRALRRFFEARPGTMQIELDGTAMEAATRLVTVCNAPLMGNNILVAPEAKMDDGLLDVSVYDGMGDAALVTHFLAATSHDPDDLKVYRVRRMRITPQSPTIANSDKNVSTEVDAVEIEIVPGAITMIVGNGIGLTVPVEAAPPAPPYAPDPHDGSSAELGGTTPPPAPAHA